MKECKLCFTENSHLHLRSCTCICQEKRNIKTNYCLSGTSVVWGGGSGNTGIDQCMIRDVLNVSQMWVLEGLI